MKLSQLPFGFENAARVTGNTDAIHVVRLQFQLDMLVDRYGDLEIEEIRPGIFDIVCLRDERKRFIKNKLAECKRWGSN